MRPLVIGLLLAGACSGGAAALPLQAGDEPAPQARAAGRAAGDASALVGALAVGATIFDSQGQPVGRVIRMETGPNGESQVRVRQGEEAYLIPVARLSRKGGDAVLDETLQQLKASGASIH